MSFRKHLYPIPVFLHKRQVTSTDSNGYFKVVLNKKSLPSSMEVVIRGVVAEYKIEQKEGRDFSISIGYFHDGKLEVVED